jgi:opacity protein-like surface antigen
MKGVLMKKVCVFLAVLLFLGTTFALSQPVPGKKFELGTSVSFFSDKWEYSDGFSDSYTILNVPVRFGWFVWKGLEIEPELTMTIPFGQDKGDMTYFLGANLAYNFKTSGRLVPFVGGSVGFGNGIPYLGWVDGGSGQKTSAYGGLAGVKYLLGNIAAIRVEYKLLLYTWKDADYPDDDETGTIHQILVGLSIFF